VVKCCHSLNWFPSSSLDPSLFVTWSSINGVYVHHRSPSSSLPELAWWGCSNPWKWWSFQTALASSVVWKSFCPLGSRFHMRQDFLWIWPLSQKKLDRNVSTNKLPISVFSFFLAWADIRLANAKFLVTLKIRRAPFSLLQPCIYYLQLHTDTIAWWIFMWKCIQSVTQIIDLHC
jgi:hypothetical protein